MGKNKKSRNNITLPEGKTILLFDAPEDFSAMPRQQRRLRERLRAKEERKVWRAHQHGEMLGADADEVEAVKIAKTAEIEK
jgi:hypothetical protein